MNEEGKRIVETRHGEYAEFHIEWRRLEDSLEGGARYREADYGMESYYFNYQIQDTETGGPLSVGGTPITKPFHHQIPRRNLIRHPREYPGPNWPSYGAGNYGGGVSGAEGPNDTSDQYEFRRALTPVPTFVEEAIDAHLSRIYSREVRRDAPAGPLGDRLKAWWLDVDGSGMSIDQWMHEAIAPLFLVLGQIDLCFDHPPAPDNEPIATKADAERLGVTRCRGCYILPENVTDWTLTLAKRYGRVVVREAATGDEKTDRYREWTPEGSRLFNGKGEQIGLDKPHSFGMVPVVRAFDRRKQRCDNVGQSRYNGISEVMRSYYNVDSELTLTNSLAAHALLSGPEDFCDPAQGTVSVGPSFLLPMKKMSGGASYQGWEYVYAPSEPADKLRQKLMDLRDQADRMACLTKPAGTSGTNGQTVSQSGVSKMLDQATGNDLLGKISVSLERLERLCVEYAATVLNDGPPPPGFLESIVLVYPKKFDLFTAADFGALIAEFQATTGNEDGELPETKTHLLRTYIRMMMPGLDDKDYEEIDAEIEKFMARKAKEAEQRAELALNPPTQPALPAPGALAETETDLPDQGDDPGVEKE